MNNKNFSNVPILWKPKGKSSDVLSEKLRRNIEEKYCIKFKDYWEFYQWTVDYISEFWAELWDFSGIICSKNYDQVIDLNLPIYESKWFEGAKLNYAENLLKYRDDKIALILAGEDAETKKLSYNQLYKEAKLYAAAFRKFGVKKGDVLMGYMSNRKESVLGMLAAVSIGAIWTGALPLMGHEAVLNRIIQVKPKVLLTVDRYLFNAEEIEMLGKIEKIAEGMTSLEKVLIVPSKEESKRKDISNIRNGCWADEFLELGREEDGSVAEMEFEQVSFSYPVFINFTSGTTGLPKPLLNGCGILLNTYRDNCLHMDTTRDSVSLSLSPVGWASWNIFCTYLFTGQTVILHEGSPYFYTPTAFWDLIDEFQITHILVTPAVIEELDKRRYLPTNKHRLSSLKLIMCGGSIVKHRFYDFIYEELKLDVLFASIWGCTELLICSVMDFRIPVYKGESPTVAYGTVVESYDEATGKPTKGEVGELVLSKPIPAMVTGLWGDDDGVKFREKYFTKYPGKFFIGDNGYINPVTKGLICIGRCDDTLKQRGCRIGVSEIYNIIDKFPEVYDSLCVSQFSKTFEERAVLFLKMREGFSISEDLVKRIKQKIGKDLTPRHVPDIVLETQEIPLNVNGKKMEIIVKKIINNLPYNSEHIQNPDSLKCYQNRKELQDFVI